MLVGTGRWEFTEVEPGTVKALYFSDQGTEPRTSHVITEPTDLPSPRVICTRWKFFHQPG